MDAILFKRELGFFGEDPPPNAQPFAQISFTPRSIGREEIVWSARDENATYRSDDLAGRIVEWFVAGIEKHFGE